MVCIGVESSEDSDLDEIGKRITSERMAEGLAAIRRYGLLVHGMFIAFAGDTAETLKRNGALRPQARGLAPVPVRNPAPGHQEHGGPRSAPDGCCSTR